MIFFSPRIKDTRHAYRHNSPGKLIQLNPGYFKRKKKVQKEFERLVDMSKKI